MHLDDDIAVLDHRELVELVEHHQQVVGDAVERVGIERTLERPPGFGLIAGAQQVHPEFGVRARGVGIHGDGFAGERDGFIEPVVPGGKVGSGAIDLAEAWVDGENPLHLRVIARRDRP